MDTELSLYYHTYKEVDILCRCLWYDLWVSVLVTQQLIMLLLYSLKSTSINLSGKNPLYVAFIAFQKAFDSVDRELLYNVLRQNGVKGKLFSAVRSNYVCVKALVRTTWGMSDTFNCPIGLRQGCS